ncbi:predicted protein [Uncinocarpus reesii 1704]|uniref:FAD/NAD(P)-binding domain-containing protein n=1 Tax=Uncinocarpus reesii (strain UAMH 1704) TaxID=336963 RepID=C4JW81_UNCRE|nr:uncharacterized protein UREG_06823 [Uncinocarpus reesii 1704]EEP81958.1 predicted protein [Uncinocarpus reesii 1704]
MDTLFGAQVSPKTMAQAPTSNEPFVLNGTKADAAGDTANCNADAINPSKAEQIRQKYAEEREKRLRPDGLEQYIGLSNTDDQSLKRLLHDQWDDGTTPSLPLEEGARYKIVIVGAGIGGLLFAVRLQDMGFKPEDMVIVDSAAGFGGTWYWNRYPGLMCDTESYIFMPLLEETGYMPKHKYAYGQELREHANRIAERWSLTDRAMFRTRFEQCAWNDETLEWTVDLTQRPPGGHSISAKIHADFVILCPGPLNRPKILRLPGVGTFQGQSFHASRWDYSVTGGTQEKPDLTNLQDKRVGIIGTGATSVQAIPHLAKWSKQLYVFQRTPASVDVRNQRPTNLQDWAEVTRPGAGWQLARKPQFQHLHLPPSHRAPRSTWSLTDGPTSQSMSVLSGGPTHVTMDNIAEYTAAIHARDLVRSERIRARVDQIIKDANAASKLKAWYSAWCKRPAFHDDYLPSFNLPNVTLVDTNGKGVQRITDSGLVANDTHFPLDVLIFASGFELKPGQSPGASTNARVFGRGGMCLDEKWVDRLSTLHGLMTSDFPNLFFTGFVQSGFSPNYTTCLETSARHTAFLIAECAKRAGPEGRKVVMEPTPEAERAWEKRIAAGALIRAPVVGCTPSYWNAEGKLDQTTPEEKEKRRGAGPCPRGMNDFMDVLQEWRDAGDFGDLRIDVV